MVTMDWNLGGEERREPPTECKRDKETSVNQYHKLTHQFYQYEHESDELRARWSTAGDNEAQHNEWKRIQLGAQGVCMHMYLEVEWGESENEVVKEKIKAQLTYKQQQNDTMEPKVGKECRQLQMFEKGKRAARRRQPVEEKSSDEEHDNQLVCNMTVTGWESTAIPDHSRLRGMRLCHAYRMV